ncbi:MAG: 50S ribosomal protein L18 [Clostridiaceae bacterium]|nr:50S ribosomal protein L18 [Clostridiales bacterium]MDD6876534.1 50S ribosomal protein L18 [Clostridiaceae bacterium]MDY3286123.1 50S ribosomal protein L18 [Eubacteriales bacterium]MDY5016523.1 50S ribosomal protein L18 [Eubacteriales bacterium]
MISRVDSNKQRKKRHVRVRGKISGTTARPRLCVYRSLSNIYAQLIDDEKGVTICSASSTEKAFEQYGGNRAAAKLVGETVARRALEKGCRAVVFDRSGYIYTGRVKELADGARAAGLEF